MRKSGINLGVPLSEPVAKFAQKMDERLDENAHKDKVGWHKLQVETVISYIHKNLKEISDKSYDLKHAPFDVAKIQLDKLADEVIQACADVGNLAMMIMDNVSHGRIE